MVTKIDWTTQSCNRWFSMRLQSISTIIVLASSLMILVGYQFDHRISPAMAGFIMTYVFISTSSMNAIVRLCVQFEVKAVNIERVLDYTRLPSEAEPIIEGHRPPASWPTNGAIHFNDHSTRYRPNLDFVLRGITLEIRPAEMICIVGRTGAGKSSLTLAFFLMVEPASSHMEIDGLSTSSIGLFDLRRQLNIIPQDGHAFDGTVRENLDPLGSTTTRGSGRFSRWRISRHTSS